MQIMIFQMHVFHKIFPPSIEQQSLKSAIFKIMAKPHLGIKYLFTGKCSFVKLMREFIQKKHNNFLCIRSSIKMIQNVYIENSSY